MKNEEAGAVSVGLIAILIIVIIFGSFYFYSKNKKNKVEVKKITVADLEDIKVKVAKETSRLNFLESRYETEKSSIGEIQNQYSRISEAVLNKTDILFNNPESKNPEIKINLAKKIKEAVNSHRLEITEAINSWNDAIQLINSNQDQNKNLPTLSALIQKAKDDSVLVSEYVQELKEIVTNLTPNNSGLTQTEINNYKASTEAALIEANKVYSDTQAIVTPIVQTPSVPGDTSTQTSESQTQSSSDSNTPTTNPPVVTPVEIKNQEQVVADAVLQQKIIEEALATTTEPSSPVSQPVDQISYPSSDILIPTGTPFQGIDKSGWPDIKPDENSKGPALLQGSNAI